MTRITALLLTSLILLPGSIRAGSGSDDPTAFVAQRPLEVLSERAEQYLLSHVEEERARFWVFFADKGIFTEEQYRTARIANANTLTPRALARRARHGITELKFTDLPVRADYVDQIVLSGAELRRVSKWLNAASFEAEPELLKRISTLPFVVRIQPVARYINHRDESSAESKILDRNTAQEAHALSYGSSYAQLDQINVPICHDSGYYGQGVVISVFDGGFRKTHDAFAQAYAEGRVLAEWDFVFNDGNVANQGGETSAWDHGTSTWSICGGGVPGRIYGPSYGASFILCKTEDVRQEIQVEEDNWAAAVEWVDSIGTDIITSSLSYTDWYTHEDYDGNTCVTTIAADIAAANGIIVCNSAGNYGPNLHTIGAPADADSIMTIGSVNIYDVISEFSSKGPTYDGRVKPEVCALGENNYRAMASADNTFGAGGSGTSFSCPLVAGCAGIVLSAHPDWTNMQVRKALMKTADRGYYPNHSYGWGIVDAWAAVNYVHVVPAGDADRNGLVNISDAVYLIAYIFAGGLAPDPSHAGDADDNGIVNISDPVFLIAYIFGGGPAPEG